MPIAVAPSANELCNNNAMHSAGDAYNKGSAERQLSRVLLWTICAGTVFGTVMALFSRVWWVAELFSHYRLYYLLAQAVLALVFLNTQRSLWLIVTLLLAIPNAWYVVPYLLPVVSGSTLQTASAQQAPQLIAFNLNYRNRDYADLLAYVRERGPDVLVLSEYTPDWDRVLAAQLDEYPYRAVRTRHTPFGLAVYSRVPLQNVRWLDLGAPGSDNLQARVNLGGRDVELFAVHLYPPTSPQRARWRRIQLARLAELMAQVPSPRMLVGDLNLTPFSPYFKELLGSADLMDARERQGLQVTWPSRPLPLWLPIDHCLTDSSAGVVDVRTGPNLGSDHYPLEVSVAVIGWQQPDSRPSRTVVEMKEQS